jgi:hypothetical protein
MIFQHAKIHRDESLKCLCVACYEGEILHYEDHVFAISCCIATLIQDARDRGVAVEPLLREYLGAEPEPGLTPAQLFDTAIAGSDAWSHVAARLREAGEQEVGRWDFRLGPSVRQRAAYALRKWFKGS